MVLVGTTVFWASDTNRALAASTNLTDWSTLTTTIGLNSYAMNPAAAAKRFFRVVQTP